jgi:porin
VRASSRCRASVPDRTYLRYSSRSSRRRSGFGIGYYYLAISHDRKQTFQGVEIFYNAALTEWLKVAADLQIVQPGVAGAPSATIFGVRLKIDF